MIYNAADITYGSITSAAGISVPGWIITWKGRRTLAATKELAQQWVDCQMRREGAKA